MACRKGELREESRNRNDAASVAVGDALLFTMMCIIGLPVDVHAKDGSIYSGIFHTASVDDDYAIVLKKARMINKGNRDANVVIGTLIETLVVQSEDLVQVVVKGVLLPSNGVTGDGVTGYVGEDSIQAATGYNECQDRDVEAVKPNKSRWNKKNKSQSRLSVKKDTTTKAASTLDNYSKDYIERSAVTNAVQIKEPHNFSTNGRYVGDDSKSELQDNHEIQDKGTSNEAQSASPSNDTLHQESHGVLFGSDSLEGQDQERERATSDVTACTVATPPNVSVASTPIINVKSESCLSASSNPYILVPPKGSSVKRTTKESKLNPGAKTFSPSVLPHRTGTPVLPNGSSDSYMTGTYPVATEQEVNGSSFARSSVPVKFVQYNNVAFGRGGNDVPYAQPQIIGQVVNRTQPVRYTGQYQNFSTGHTYVQPNPQNVMFGRVGPLVCMHPISSDVIQGAGAAGFPAAASRPILPPHQVHLAKHQGNASAQALQLCMNPPIMANAPPSFVVPNSIPISQPVFPVLRQIAVPGANGFISSKLA